MTELQNDAEFEAAREDTDARVGALEAQVETLTLERDAAIARADKAEAATKRAKAKVTQGEQPAKLRTLKPMDAAGDRDALPGALYAAETVEIAFSDGKREVPGVAPLRVEGEAWKPHSRGLMLRDPVTVQGPDGGTSTTIAGYALLIDGKQVAYTERGDSLAIAPGQKVELRDDIYF